MKFQVFGLLLCVAISIHGEDECTFDGDRCFIGGYEHFPDIGYYKLYSRKTKWDDAWKQCKDDGGHLVVINSQKEYEIIRKIQKAVGTDVQIGMHDLFKEGIYVTLTGEDFISSDYLKWDKGQPDNHNNEDCILLRLNGLLNDILCSSPNYFICELYPDPSHHLTPK